MFKRFFLLGVFVFGFSLLITKVSWANTCTGSYSYTYKSCSCGTFPSGTQYCNCSSSSQTAYCQWLFSGAYCGYCYKVDSVCTVSGGKCSTYDPSGVPCSGAMPGNTGCSICVTVNGNCNDEDYTAGVCQSSQITKKCDAGTSGTIKDNGSSFTWTCYGNSCSDSKDDYCSVPKLSSTYYPGGNGVCGSSSGTSVCSWSNLTSLCSSSYGSLATDTVGSDGSFNWTCYGQAADPSACRAAGTAVNCSATRIMPVSPINGVCSSVNGTVVQTKPTDLCVTGTPTTVITSGTTYSWSCVGTNGVCPTVASTNQSCSATQDTPPDPIIVPIPDPPTSTDPAPNPSGGQRLHNCQFSDPNLVTLKVGVTDANGISDIAGVYLRFSGLTTEYGPIKPAANGVVTFSLNITNMPNGVYSVQVKADDVHSPISSGWVTLPYSFKKWDCLVNVSGTFYDGSDVPISCAANTGYTNPIPGELSFDFRYTIGTSSPRNMTVVSPNFNSDANNRLYWNSPVDYQPLLINFPGTNPTQAKINNVCYNTAALDPGIADPYAATPSLSIQYSSILDQEAWYRATNGSVVSKGITTNYVPATCTVNCKTVNNTTPMSNDIILSAKTASLSPYDKVADVTNDMVYDNKVLNLKPYSYDSLRKQYFSTKGVGTTTLSSATWSQLPTKLGVIFVNGDLTIDADIATTDLVMIIVKGTITVNPNVTRIDGVMMGNNIIISGKSATQLVINGSIYSTGDVSLNRSFEPKSLNNKNPAVEVKYNPSLIFKLPPKMIQAVSRWRLVQ